MAACNVVTCCGSKYAVFMPWCQARDLAAVTKGAGFFTIQLLSVFFMFALSSSRNSRVFSFCILASLDSRISTVTLWRAGNSDFVASGPRSWAGYSLLSPSEKQKQVWAYCCPSMPILRPQFTNRKTVLAVKPPDLLETGTWGWCKSAEPSEGFLRIEVICRSGEDRELHSPELPVRVQPFRLVGCCWRNAGWRIACCVLSWSSSSSLSASTTAAEGQFSGESAISLACTCFVF